MRRIAVVEGVPFSEPQLARAIRVAGERLTAQLRPRLRPVIVEEASSFTVRNVIGALRLDENTVLEVTPKVGGHDDWVRAVLDLLVGPERIDIGGERLSDLAPRRPELLEVLASAYAARLRRALHRDGPLLLIDRRYDNLGVLKGKLATSSYLRSASWRPHIFPLSYDVLSPDNQFARAMAVVARLLATATSSPSVRGSLFESAIALRPGYPEDVRVEPSVTSRPLPEQWGVYRPAWSIAVSVLSRASLLRATGQQHGVEVAIEAWPLLERLLERALDEATRAAQALGRDIARLPKPRTPLLVSPSEGGRPHGVEPDGQLVENGATIATFEGKYAARGSRWPADDHVFQALTTAAACQSPLSVLIYPEMFSPVWWDVLGFGGTPKHLVAVGLGLFSYRRGVGDRERAQLMLGLLKGRPTGVVAGVVPAAQGAAPPRA
jgi:hypothetical protein